VHSLKENAVGRGGVKSLRGLAGWTMNFQDGPLPSLLAGVLHSAREAQEA
jgi:hypothetical protein